MKLTPIIQSFTNNSHASPGMVIAKNLLRYQSLEEAVGFAERMVESLSESAKKQIHRKHEYEAALKILGTVRWE